MKYSPDDAVLLHLLRTLNITDPIGTWHKNLWIPHPLYEQRACCTGISQDTRAPLTVIDHCRSLRHVCTLLEVDHALAYNALQEEHWRILRRLLLWARQETRRTSARGNPTAYDYAPIIVRYARQFAHQFSTNELKTIAQWISQYYPEVLDINWNAAQAFNLLQER